MSDLEKRFRDSDGELMSETFVFAPDITEAAFRIIGQDLVKAVYAAYDHGAPSVDSDGDIYIGDTKIVMEMANGKLVKFSSSEWAYIAAVTRT